MSETPIHLSTQDRPALCGAALHVGMACTSYLDTVTCSACLLEVDRIQNGAVAEEASTPVSHLAGPVIDYQHEDGNLTRQRCSWCGTILVDENASRIAVAIPEGKTADDVLADRVPGWPPGRFVDCYTPDGKGGMTTLNDWEPPAEGERRPIPATACLRMPPEVTA